MQKIHFYTIMALALIIHSAGHAQEVFSLQEAIEIGLENNYGIRVARNDSEISSINKNIGEAGFLPRVDLGAEHSTLEDDFVIEDRNNDSESDLLEESVYQGAQISLDWSIFQGFWKITNYKKLGKLEDMGRETANITIENTVSAITEAYYNIVSHEKRIEVLTNTVEISDDRREIAEMKYELGAGSEYALLVTQTDLNVDQTDVIREKTALYRAQMELLELLNLDPDTDFQVQTEIELSDLLSLEELRETASEMNRQLQVAHLRKNVSELEEKEIRSQRLPEISLNASYTLSNEDMRENALHTIERRDGAFYGLTARMNLFNGFKTNRQAKIAKINTESSAFLEQQLQQELETLLRSTYKAYTASIELTQLEEENLELARNSLDIAFELFRLGKSTPVELREAQRTHLNTETRLISAMFEAKIHETELLRISGKLLEEYGIKAL